MIEASDIYYCGSLLPWADFVDAHPERFDARTRATAAQVFRTQGEIFCALSEIEELRLRVARA